MKISFLKLKFDYTYLIVALGLVLTGHFLNLMVFTSLIIIHEFGHFIVAKSLKYEIDEIIIYPYGGLTKFNMPVNTNINKDLLVTISGIILQSLYFYIIYLLFNAGVIRDYTYNLFCIYHRSMILFNILPIIPLDGSKFACLILCKFISFNVSNYLTVIISFLTIIFLLITNLYQNNYSFLMTISILLINIYKFYSDMKLIYNKFLLERYLYDFDYKEGKVLLTKENMLKNKKHFFYINNKLCHEKEYLEKYFKNFR